MSGVRLRLVAASSVALVAVLTAATACSGGDEAAVRSAGARAARSAASEAATVRLAASAYLDGKVWSAPGRRIVADAEAALTTTASSFDQRQPSTAAARRTYDEVTSALDDGEQAVTATRIALDNGDRPGVRSALIGLDKSVAALRELGELAK